MKNDDEDFYSKNFEFNLYDYEDYHPNAFKKVRGSGNSRNKELMEVLERSQDSEEDSIPPEDLKLIRDLLQNIDESTFGLEEFSDLEEDLDLEENLEIKKVLALIADLNFEEDLDLEEVSNLEEFYERNSKVRQKLLSLIYIYRGFQYSLVEFGEKNILECMENISKYLSFDERCLFSDYYFLDKDILNIAPIKYKELKKTTIVDINTLRKELDWIIDYSGKLIYMDEIAYTGISNSMYLDKDLNPLEKTTTGIGVITPISEKDKELLIDQLIFDILFEKYLDDEGEMTLEDYCYAICLKFPELASYYDKNYDPSGPNSKQDLQNSIKAMRQIIDEHIENYSSANNEMHVLMFGVLKDDFVDLMNARSNTYKNIKNIEENKVTKPRVFWDNVFLQHVSFPNLDAKKTNTGRYSKRKLILRRQFEGTYDLKNSNRKYDDFIIDNKIYGDFIDVLTTGVDLDDKTYFENTMLFYTLETEHRMEYIYNLSIDLANNNFDEIELGSDFCLSSRFDPFVSQPEIVDNKIRALATKKYYKSMLLHNKYYQEQFFNNKELKIKASFMFNTRIRAKSFEIFKFYYNFVSNDYSQMNAFIKDHYNLIGYYKDTEFVKGYYNPDKIWKYVDSFKNKNFENEEIISSLKDSNFFIDNNKTYNNEEIAAIIKRLILLNIKSNESWISERTDLNKNR